MRPIYLDHNATTPLLPAAWEAMRDVPPGNPSSAHTIGRAARRALEDAREKIAALLGAFPDEVTFTSGATEGNNLAVFGLLPSPLGGEGGERSEPGEGKASEVREAFPSPAASRLPSPPRGEGENRPPLATASLLE